MKIEGEKYLDEKLKRGIEKLEGWYLKIPTIHISGLPDRICLLPGGITVFAEIKTTKKTPGKLQKWVHKKLIKLGFQVYIIDTSEAIKELLYENRKNNSNY